VSLLELLAGATLLVFGRRLFWLFVGVTGFVLGAGATALLADSPEPWMVPLISVTAGIIGVVLAVFAQRIAVVVGGFIGGAYLFTQVAALGGSDSGQTPWLPLIIGGVLGAVLLARMFDWALIVLSSLVGSLLIAGVFASSNTEFMVVTVALSVIGMAIQARAQTRKKRNTEMRDSA
jgi:hypothetical protein